MCSREIVCRKRVDISFVLLLIVVIDLGSQFRCERGNEWGLMRGGRSSINLSSGSYEGTHVSVCHPDLMHNKLRHGVVRFTAYARLVRLRILKTIRAPPSINVHKLPPSAATQSADGYRLLSSGQVSKPGSCTKPEYLSNPHPCVLLPIHPCMSKARL